MGEKAKLAGEGVIYKKGEEGQLAGEGIIKNKIFKKGANQS